MVSEEHFAPIAALDLDLIKTKLIAEPGNAWSVEKTDTVERDYRRFLYLMKIFPNEQTAPSIDVDRFWRVHILETRQYAADCARAFGYFLHRYPYLGLRGDGDDALRRRCGEQMRQLYEATFGETCAGAGSEVCAFSSASRDAGPAAAANAA